MSDATLPREIAPDIHWIGRCVPIPLKDEVIHQHVSAFLVLGERETLLVDTGNALHWDEVQADLDAILGERPLDWLLPTHPELAHAGNLGRLLRRYEGARVLGDVRDYHLYFPDDIDRLVPMRAGEGVDLGGREIVLLDALVKDLPNSQWAFERSQRVLFVGDGFSYTHMPGDEPLHMPGECALMTDEMPDAPTPEQATFLVRAAMYWTRWVDAGPLFRELDTMLDQLRPAIVAPAHGNLIVNLERVSARIEDAYRAVYQASLA
jgi:flavorubredoxin